MGSRNIFCFVCTELQISSEIHASRLGYPLNSDVFKLTTILSLSST